MNKKKLIFIVFLILISCNSKIKNKNIITEIEVLEKSFNFGKAKLNDTVVHTFKIKNITNVVLRVNNIATSCGCTIIDKIDSLAKKNEFIKIKIQFIPKKEQIGTIVSNSIVVETNTTPNYTILKLKGSVIN